MVKIMKKNYENRVKLEIRKCKNCGNETAYETIRCILCGINLK